jgi:hypothetical protein
MKSDMLVLRTCFTRRKPPKSQLRPIRALHLPRHRNQRPIVATAATNFKQYRSTVGHALGYHSSLKFARFPRRFGKTVRSDTAHQGKAFLLLRLDRKSLRFRFIVEVKSAIVYAQPSTSLIVFDILTLVDPACYASVDVRTSDQEDVAAQKKVADPSHG